MLLAILSFLGGVLALVAGAEGLVRGAASIARRFGISPLIIGLTVVAVGTSLPELATSVVAALRGESDVALGNVVGSNIFNVLGILGITAWIHPIDATGLSWLDGAVMVGFAVVTLPLLWTGYSFSRLEGALLVGGYLAYVVVLVSGGV